MKIVSNFKQDTISSQGPGGFFQVKPSLVRFIAEDLEIEWNGHGRLDEPSTNIKMRLHFFSHLKEYFQNIDMALKAHNKGHSTARASSRVNSKSTNGFPGLVMKEYTKNISVLPDP